MTGRTKIELYEIFKNMSASLLMVVLSMTGFWMMQGKDLVTRGEVIELINTTGPYVIDQGVIRTEISALHSTDEKTGVMLDRVALTLDDLKVAIVRLNTTLQNMDEQHGNSP